MSIMPINNKILIEWKDNSTININGFKVNEKYIKNNQENTGIILDLDKNNIKSDLNIGDKVMFAVGGTNFPFKFNKSKFVLVDEKDILMKIKD